MVSTFHKTVHGLCYLAVKGVVYFNGDTDRKQEGAKFCIPVFIPHNSASKFCVYFTLGFVALPSEHRLPHAVVGRVVRTSTRKQESISLRILYTVSNV
jgi:hypothetical protein